MPRKRKEEIPLPYGITPGNVVKVTSGINFKGPKVGLVAGPCKKCQGGIEVYIPDDSMITRWFCIQEERGDTIVKVS